MGQKEGAPAINQLGAGVAIRQASGQRARQGWKSKDGGEQINTPGDDEPRDGRDAEAVTSPCGAGEAAARFGRAPRVEADGWVSKTLCNR